ncbi:P-loop containing nucleoside triphosphate hydrolase protein [Rhodofomes roseus]|uniref:P-loop containing nucleoside triphosphate hydrolase protein n=1 Tax=Rhodofomes roseus TaxID=34475 RepID=A0ABQ8KPI4_9APHY|nr:P-loop containing nucleoside triphosphate hydrolase protein [Rhodofomes roseus]KAH9840532.1 P-loop containing nucleoside triphosphate hydrolase protein [Rhodofomes roseus]
MLKRLRRRSKTTRSTHSEASTTPFPEPVMATAQSTNIADTEYARQRREVYALLKDLKELGAQSNIRIPRIAVIGAQSTGKSSLVEAVTGINVPRDSGTCTRCPMECTISTAAPDWQCQISLQYDPDGQTRREPFSGVLNSKAEVEIWVRRAQTALLSPHVPRDSFKTKTYQELKELTASDPQMLKFARDVVVVDINDPQGTDLSFIDLPGLVQNMDDEVINLVKDLVERYIADDSTIILITVPANDDMENQQAARLAREADPDGERTIAVVTKPDSLTDGEIGAQERWLNILQGRVPDHELRLGYYIVRLANDTERRSGITRQDLDRRADELFSTTLPWNQMLNSGRLGLRNFINDISKLLMGIIEDAIPRLREEAEARLAQINHDIAGLPEKLTADPTTEVFSRMSKFCTAMQDDVYGRSEDKEFVHESQAVYKDFKIAIYKTLPDFRPFIDHAKHQKPTDPPSQSDQMDQDTHDIVVDFENGPFDLEYVRWVIKECTGWQLPPHIPYEAKERLIGLSVDKWPAPAAACYERIRVLSREYIDSNVRDHFGQFKPLESYIGKLIRDEHQAHHKKVSEAVRDVVEREKLPYITQNLHYLHSARESWLQHYRSAYGISVTTYDSYGRLRCAYEDELTVMADVRAYVQVAYKRIIDNIPMTIQRDLNQVFVDDLLKRLISKLDLESADASDRLKKLLEENPVIANRRVQLATDQRRLEDIVTKLSNFVV